jgi:hypothetical protein
MSHLAKFLLPLVLVGCDDKGDDSASGGALVWYSTCGDPSCGGYNAASHTAAPCTTEVELAGCAPSGASCDLQTDCNTELVCATEDPKEQEGGCPISLRAAKTGIHYVDAMQAERLHQALLEVRLADYQYRDGVASPGQHLGFIIDDQPSDSPAVRPDGQRVDLYGYTSMAVAALQVQDLRLKEQERQLEAQRAELQALHNRLAALEAR